MADELILIGTLTAPVQIFQKDYIIYLEHSDSTEHLLQ